MSIMTSWLADIKLGRCSTGWWLNRKFCCLEISEADTCEEWRQWGAIQPFPWVSYVIYAVSLRPTSSE
jgi:chloride channel 3/4/5